MSVIRSLSLQFFRLFDKQSIRFSSKVTLFFGKNGSGKTSVIEAIELLSTAQSFRAGKVDEMIKLANELGRIEAEVVNDEEKVQLEILLTRGEVQGKRTQKQLYSVNGVRRRKRQFIGNFFSISFRPEDMRLIEGSPARRRQLVDTVLTQVDNIYSRSLATYLEALKKINKLLPQVREREMPASVLKFWQLQLLKHGQIIQKKRQSFFEFYRLVDFPFAFQVHYLPSVMNEERLEQYALKAIAAGHMLIGPHKDDYELEFKLGAQANKWQSVHAYGSRGQQRLAVLWLKLGALQFIESELEQKPVLLLDDIFSELDEVSKEHVLSVIKNQQTIISSADLSIVDELKAAAGKITVIGLE